MSSGSSPGMGAATIKRSCVRYTFTGIHCNFGCSCIYCTSPDDQIIHLAWAWWIHKRLTNPIVYKFHGIEEVVCHASVERPPAAARKRGRLGRSPRPQARGCTPCLPVPRQGSPFLKGNRTVGYQGHYGVLCIPFLAYCERIYY